MIRYILEQYVNFRQFLTTMKVELPDNLKQLNIKHEEFLLSQAYANDKMYTYH